MRKELLINSLLQYSRETAFRPLPTNSRIVLLKAFLNSPQIAGLPPSAEIPFAQFEAYLKKQNQDSTNLFSLDYFRKGTKSVKVFIKFKYGIMNEDLKVAISKIPIPNVTRRDITGPFDPLPSDIKQFIYNEYLSDQDIGRLAQTSSFFKSTTDTNSVWLNRLIQLGCDRDLLLQLHEANIIRNYKILYKNVKNFLRNISIKIECLWQLLCLSGELRALHFGLESGKINNETRDVNNSAPIHYLALAGHVEGLKLLEEKFALKMNAENDNSENILHYAAASNSPATMQYAIEKNIGVNSFDDHGWNAIHWACSAGAEASLRYAVDVLKLDKKLYTHAFHNALHLAVINNNKKGVLLALNVLKISPKSKAGRSCGNALHVAAARSSIEMLKFIHKELKLPYQSKDFYSAGILHYACRNNNPEVMRFIAFELRINPNDCGAFSQTPLHWAAESGNVPCIKSGVIELNMNLYSEVSSGETPMHFAIAKKRKAAVIALREVGYDPNHRDKNDHTAFDYLNTMRGLSPVEKVELLEALTCEVKVDKKLSLPKMRG